MGTMISLSLNDIDIDFGMNRHWNSHHWLFPSGSITDIEYRYADDMAEVKPGFQTTLDEAYFRLCHLGYSLHETKIKFERSLARWNRTADLKLSFEDFRDCLAAIDFDSLTPADMEAHDFDFRILLLKRLAAWDNDDALLEDFVTEHLDFNLILRCLAERTENRGLMLRWHHQDLVDSGWATLEDLTEIDRETSIINHTMLMGRLQDHTAIYGVNKFDNWLQRHGLPRGTRYTELLQNGEAVLRLLTLPSAVRNMIHHPENQHNTLSDEDLRVSTEMLLAVVKQLPTPLPGIG